MATSATMRCSVNQDESELKRTVAQKRRYQLLNVEQARSVASAWIDAFALGARVDFGLPEVDDRYHIWRVPVLQAASKHRVGECVIDAKTATVVRERSTDHDVLRTRLERPNVRRAREQRRPRMSAPVVRQPVPNTIALGKSEDVLPRLDEGSIDLVFTSPPYYNARPEYTDYVSYEDYLEKMRSIIRACSRVLAEGRFFVLNVAPVLIRRTDRGSASRRIAVPFDFHRLFVEEGFDFIDDIIWLKPEGAGWATGRGRRFAADRNPLQYKAVPVTEYLLVYRKHTDKLIDWHIRSHPNPELVQQSKIADGYERTNVWKITPAHTTEHPAVFPLELAEKVLAYYSFKGDTVLDPFAGVGTVGAAAVKLGRGFCLVEQTPKYVELIRESALHWLKERAAEVRCINCPPLQKPQLLF